jgi:hypothetical protein
MGASEWGKSPKAIRGQKVEKEESSLYGEAIQAANLRAASSASSKV